HRSTTAAMTYSGHEERPRPRRLDAEDNCSITAGQRREAALKTTKGPHVQAFRSAPERIRTSDLRFRRPTLYPAELRAQAVHCRGRIFTALFRPSARVGPMRRGAAALAVMA